MKYEKLFKKMLYSGVTPEYLKEIENIKLHKSSKKRKLRLMKLSNIGIFTNMPKPVSVRDRNLRQIKRICLRNEIDTDILYAKLKNAYRKNKLIRKHIEYNLQYKSFLFDRKLLKMLYLKP